MIDRAHPTLSISRQCHLLNVSRASVYRRPAPVSADDLRLMELIDRQYLARPFYGSRRMAAWLATQGHPVNRKRVQRLMRLMGLVAIYQRPKTSKAAPEHIKYPYLLGGLTIDRVNQVWCSDITCCATIKTPRPATIWHTSDGGAAFGGQAGVKPEAARGGGPKGQALHQPDGRTS